jgi:hypothetical protein
MILLMCYFFCCPALLFCFPIVLFQPYVEFLRRFVGSFQPLKRVPVLGGRELDLFKLYHAVIRRGGFHQIHVHGFFFFLSVVLLVFLTLGFQFVIHFIVLSYFVYLHLFVPVCLSYFICLFSVYTYTHPCV